LSKKINNNLYYNGDTRLKADLVEMSLTKEQEKEYAKCRKDPIYFIENYCYITNLNNGLQLFKLFDCQKNKIKIMKEKSRVIMMEARQSGKCHTKDTVYNIRNKKTGEIRTITALEFHNLHNPSIDK
jgi:hypothetical protein